MSRAILCIGFIVIIALGLIILCTSSSVASGASEPGMPALPPVLSHRVDIDCTLVSNHLAHIVRVRSGDTLGHIAKREMGSVRHVAAIRALNPGVVPTRIRPGEPLWVPPREGGYALYVWHTDGDRAEIVLYGPNDPVPPTALDLAILAVPMDRLKQFRSWESSSAVPMDPTKVPHAIYSQTIRKPTARTVHSGAARSVTTYRITSIQDKTSASKHSEGNDPDANHARAIGVEMDVSSRSFDRHGRPLVARSRGQGLGLLISIIVILLVAGVVVMLASKLEK